LFALAVAEARVLVTADLDFAPTVSLSGLDGPGFILFRAGNIADLAMLALVRRVLAEARPASLSRSVVVFDEHSIRIAS